MSKIFFKIVSDVFELTFNRNYPEVSFVVFMSCSFFHSNYVYGTSKIEYSSIIKKYKMVRGGYTDFMVIDKKGNHYNVNNSIWYWKWNSIEDWNNIKEGDELKINYYGWRIPILGIFPKIYTLNKL
jgi:hypothetical protein